MVLAIEGPAFSGKTTVLNSIRHDFFGEARTVPEGSEYITRDVNQVNFDFGVLQEAMASVHFCLEVEAARSRDAKAGGSESDSLVIMDRSFFSNLLYYLTLENSSADFAKLMPGFLGYALRGFATEFDEGRLVVPDKLVVLSPRDKDVFEGRLQRGTHSKFLAEWENFNFSMLLYSRLLSSYYPGPLSMQMVTEDTSDNLQSVTKGILTFGSEPGAANISTKDIFEHFLGMKIDVPKLDWESEKRKFTKIRKLALDLLGTKTITS